MSLPKGPLIQWTKGSLLKMVQSGILSLPRNPCLLIIWITLTVAQVMILMLTVALGAEKYPNSRVGPKTVNAKS